MRTDAPEDLPPGSRAVVYARISKDVTRTGMGVRRQLEACRKLIERRGWQEIEIFSDNDVSAYSGTRRPRYEDMLSAIAEKRVDVVVCWHHDRLYRQISDLERYIDVCQAATVPTHAVMSSALNLTLPSGRLQARIAGSVALYEAEQKGARHRAANEQRALQGKMHVTRRPFGYEPDGVTIRDVEAQAIREGVESILNEGSLYGLAKRWNEAGLLPPQGRHRSQEELAAHAEAVEDALAKNEEPPPLPSLRPSRWTGERVRAHFRSRRIAGIVTYKGEEVRDPETGEPVPATWPAIITREQWRAVQRVLETNSQKRRFPSGERQLLSGLARCAECGSPMMSGGQRNGRRRIRCGLKGQHVYRESGPIDDYVERVMIARLSRPETRRQLTIATAPAVDVAGIEAQLRELDTSSIEMAEAHARNEITLPQLLAFNRVTSVKREELESQLPMPASPAAREILEADDVGAAWHGLTQDAKRALIDAFCVIEILAPGTKENAYLGDYRKRIVNPETVRITWKTP